MKNMLLDIMEIIAVNGTAVSVALANVELSIKIICGVLAATYTVIRIYKELKSKPSK